MEGMNRKLSDHSSIADCTVAIAFSQGPAAHTRDKETTMTNARRPTAQLLRGGESLRSSIQHKGRKRRNDLAALSASRLGKFRNDILPKLELVYFNPYDLTAPARNVRALDPVHVTANYEFDYNRRVHRSGSHRPGQQHPRWRNGHRGRQRAGADHHSVRSHGPSHGHGETHCSTCPQPAERERPLGPIPN